MGGGDGNSGPTLQEQQLQTAQALTTANLNLQENQQRKSILNAMMGTRVFRGSALSRALVGNTPGQGGENATGAPSASQVNNQVIAPTSQTSLVDGRNDVVPGSSSDGAGSIAAGRSGTSGGARR